MNPKNEAINEKQRTCGECANNHSIAGLNWNVDIKPFMSDLPFTSMSVSLPFYISALSERQVKSRLTLSARLLDVFPRPSIANVFDSLVCFRNRENLPNLVSTHSFRTKISNFYNLIFRKLVFVVRLPSYGSPSICHISHVFLVISEIKVLWVNAGHIIARVKNKLMFWEFTKMDSPRQSMRRKSLSPFVSNCSVSGTPFRSKSTASPFPARVSFLNIFPKSFFENFMARNLHAYIL